MSTVFKDRVALVVGKNTGIGEEIAKRLSSGGAATVLSARADALKEMDRVERRHGKVDIFVNVIPTNVHQVLDALTDDDFRADLDNVLAWSFSLLRVVLPSMRRKRYGRILNVSRLDYLGLPGRTAAAAAQAGIFGLTRAMALEIACDNITVNNLVLGDIAADAGVSPEDAEVRAAAVPVKRIGSAADAAYAAAYFAAEEAKYVTGQTFFVCGGRSVHFSMSV